MVMLILKQQNVILHLNLFASGISYIDQVEKRMTMYKSNCEFKCANKYKVFISCAMFFST